MAKGTEVPIVISDSDESDSDEETSVQTVNTTTGSQMEANASKCSNDDVTVDGQCDDESTKRNDLENEAEDDVKRVVKIERTDEMANLPMVEFDPNQESATFSEDSADGTEPAALNIRNQPIASMNVQIQLTRCDGKRLKFNNSTSISRPKGHLTKQQLIHKDRMEKAFKCNQCNYVSRYKSNLSVHKLIHGGGSTKRFKCDQCDFAARHKHVLKAHQQIHVGQKLIGVVQDTNDGMYKCTRCPQRFTKVQFLAQHFTKAHKNNQRRYNCVYLNGFINV